MCENGKKPNRLLPWLLVNWWHMLVFTLLTMNSSLMGWGRTQVPPHVKAATKVENAIVDAIQGAGFKIVGSGGSMMERVSDLTFAFDITGYASVDEARELIMAGRALCVEIGLADETIAQYLDQAPFSDRHISLQFVFCSTESIWPPEGYLSAVVSGGKGIDFRVAQKPALPSRVLHMETLDEAKRRVKGLSLEEAVQALPRTAEEAGPPIWNAENYYRISITGEEMRTRYYSNPMFAEKK